MIINSAWTEGSEEPGRGFCCCTLNTARECGLLSLCIKKTVLWEI